MKGVTEGRKERKKEKRKRENTRCPLTYIYIPKSLGTDTRHVKLNTLIYVMWICSGF